MAVLLIHDLDLSKKSEMIQISSYQKEDDHIVFNIQVQIGPCRWTLNHRYSDFVQFDEQRFKNLKESLLPPKKFVKNQSAEFLDRRQKDLELYLLTVFEFEIKLRRMNNGHGLPRPLSKFLDFHKYEMHSLLEDLAEKLYKTGETSLASENYKELSPLILWAITERLKLAEPTCSSSNPKLDFGHVIDFTHRLERLKIQGSTNTVGTSNVYVNSLPFSLHCFKSVRKLWLSSVNVSSLSGLDTAKSTAEVLLVHNSLSLHGLRPLLANHDNVLAGIDDKEISCNGAQEEQSLPSTWTKIRRADFSQNALREIDEAIKCLRTVEILNLSRNQLTELNNLQHLVNLTDLSLANNLIADCTNWHTKLGNLKKLNISSNRITNLKGLSKLYSLERLDMRNNYVMHPTDVYPIGKLPCLTALCLQGNPIESSVEYRTKVLEAFGERAFEVQLDGSCPDSKELDTISVRLAIRKGIEDRERILRRARDEISRSLNINVGSGGSSLNSFDVADSFSSLSPLANGQSSHQRCQSTPSPRISNNNNVQEDQKSVSTNANSNTLLVPDRTASSTTTTVIVGSAHNCSGIDTVTTGGNTEVSTS